MRAIILRGKKVSLSIPTVEDVKRAWIWWNDRRVRKHLTSPGEIFFYEEEMAWYDTLKKEKEKEKVFSIIENSSKSFVGLIGLHKIDRYNEHAELGYFVGPEYWGHGFATEAVGLALEYAFIWLKLGKIYAHVFETNLPSIRVLEKNGFQLAGRLRRHQYVPGEGFVDVLIYERFPGEQTRQNYVRRYP